MNKKGKLSAATILLDVVGFSTIVVGAALIRFSKDEVISIVGGFVLSAGVMMLSLTRLMK